MLRWYSWEEKRTKTVVLSSNLDTLLRVECAFEFWHFWVRVYCAEKDGFGLFCDCKSKQDEIAWHRLWKYLIRSGIFEPESGIFERDCWRRRKKYMIFWAKESKEFFSNTIRRPRACVWFKNHGCSGKDCSKHEWGAPATVSSYGAIPNFAWRQWAEDLMSWSIRTNVQ